MNYMYRTTASNERYMFFFGNRYPICFSFMVRINGRLTAELLRQALGALASRHALLSARVVFNEKNEQFITNQDVGEFEIRDFSSDNRSWEEIALELLTYPFNIKTGPFVRFGLRHIDKKTELFIIFHHAIADGGSGVILLRDLFSILGGSPPIQPVSGEGLFLFDALKPEVQAELSKREKPSWATEKPEVKGPATVVPFSRPPFKIHSREIGRAETAKLLACAKAMGATVHCVLGAIFLRSYADIFGEKTGYTRTLQSPVDCRKYVKEEYRNTVGSFISIIKTPIDCSPGRSLAQIAREISAKLAQSTADYKDVEGFYFFKGFFDGEPDPEAVMCEFTPDPPDYDFSLSNMGRIDLAPRYGEWEIESVFGPTFTAVHGEQVIGLNTHNGVIRFTYIYDTAVFPEKTGSTIWESGFRRLHELLAEV